MLKTFSKQLRNIIAVTIIISMLMTNVVTFATTNIYQDKTSNENSNSKVRSVLYYGTWSIWGGSKNFYPSKIPAKDITHLIVSNLDFDSNGVLKSTDIDADLYHDLGREDVEYGDVNGGILNALMDLKVDNPNLKIGVSLGGNSFSGDFSTVCADDAKRATLVNNLMDYLTYTNMDFIDIDWENPTEVRLPNRVDSYIDEGTPYATSNDKEYLTLLAKDIKAAMDEKSYHLNKDYELSAALPASYKRIDNGIDVEGLFKYIDFANVKTYNNLTGKDTIVGHHTGLYTNPNDPKKGTGISIDETVTHYLSKGAPSDKLVIGASYYTKGWEKVVSEGLDKDNPPLFGEAALANKEIDGTLTTGANGENPRDKTGTWSYNALDKLKVNYTNLNEYWDDSAKAPYLYSNVTGSFFSYDNTKSIKEKADYVRTKKLGGIAGWDIAGDKSIAGTSKMELSNATKVGLFGESNLPEYIVKTNNLNVSTVLDYFANNDGKTGVMQVYITNNEKITSSDKLIKSVEESNKTFKNGKIYIKTDGAKIIDVRQGTPKPYEVDGYYVFDLSKLEKTKFLSPGESTVIEFIVDKTEVNEGTIKKMNITQRMYKDSTEFGKQMVYYSTNDDILFLAEAATRYNTTKESINWSDLYDLNNDSIIDLFDLTIIAKGFK